MFVYYEHHKDARGKIVLTEMRLSSFGNGRLAIAFKNIKENTLFELCKSVLKMPPVAFRSYDENSKVWSFLEGWGVQVLEKLHEITKPIDEIVEYEVEDLQTQCLQGSISFGKRKKTVRPEDFFYNTGAGAASPVLTKEQIVSKLASLMQVPVDSIDKKAYRAAAMRLHPDRNQGNGAMMSELNMYWRLYNA